MTDGQIFLIYDQPWGSTKEAIFSLDKLLKADEVFITNSLFGVLQVKKIKNRSWQHQELASLFNQELENLNI